MKGNIIMKSFVAALVTLAIAQVVPAQSPANVARPAGVSKDPASVPAGTYKLDPRHTSVIARVGHGGGTSFSTFRFGTASGTLDWKSADTAGVQLSVSVDMTSIETPVPNFASELIGDRFLKTGQFHDATFVSKNIQRTAANAARISGDLTFMGQTRPAVIDATMVGMAVGRSGPVIGFSGTLRFKRSDYGFTAMTGPIGDEVEMLLDTEFGKVP